VVAPEIPGTDRLTAVRASLPALSAGIYLNTGSVGPLPAETAAAMADLARYELETGRAHPDHFPEIQQRMAEARSAVAALLVADVDDIALGHSTTDGVNAGVWSIDWAAGDRVVTTSGEHPAVLGPLVQLRDRRGVELVFVDADPDGEEAATLAAFDDAIDARTRMVVLSHVLYASGARLPLAAIAAAAHERGALVVVDGAQSIGAIPVDLAATGADVLALPAQKWLLGPSGMGALAVSRRVRDRLQPTFAGYATFERLDPSGASALWPSAQRFEWSNWHTPSIVGMARSIGWMSMFIGLDWFQTRGPALAAWMADRLAAIDGVSLLTPRASMATLIAFRIAGWTPQAALDELGARVFAIARTVPTVDALRISVGAWNSEDELERFASAVELLAAHTPETLPPRRTLTLLGEA
jgi:L-cysteine/cystine lyase